MPATPRDLLASLLGETPQQDQAPALQPKQPAQEKPRQPSPRANGPAGPWRVTASASGGLVQISNNHESRLIRKVQLGAYLRTPAGG
jgi:hypothetical protein